MTPLEKYYGKFKEEHRLTTRHGQVEFTVSMKYIHDYLEQIKASSNTAENSRIKIIDIGAGTGRYSVELSREDYDVTAVELVKHNLDILRAKHEKVKCWQGNALDLNFIDDGVFDAAILFGPMYHLHSVEEKVRALDEARRVTKKGGLIFVAYVMNDYSIISYCFKEGHIKECVERASVTKDFHAVDSAEELYSYVRLDDIDEIKRLSNKNAPGLVRQKIFAPDGAADYMRRELNAMDEESFKLFIEYQMAVCERPELLGASSHIVDVLKNNF